MTATASLTYDQDFREETCSVRLTTVYERCKMSLTSSATTGRFDDGNLLAKETHLENLAPSTILWPWISELSLKLDS